MAVPEKNTVSERRELLPTVEFEIADELNPLPGDATHLPHITGEHYEADRTTFTLFAQAASTVPLRIRRNGVLEPKPLLITMPQGSGYVSRTVTLHATGPVLD